LPPNAPTEPPPVSLLKDEPPSFAQEAVEQPRTSEVFKAADFQAAGEAAPASSDDSSSLAMFSEVARGSAEPLDRAREEPNRPGVEAQLERSAAASATGDLEQSGEPRIPWVHVVLMGYSSAVTLVLAWMIWHGGAFRSVERPFPVASQPGAEAPSTGTTEDPEAEPPIPTENLTVLGKPIRLGELEVTPLEVVARPLELVRSIEPSEIRVAESDSLVLRLKFTNVSRAHAFAPLGPDFVRLHASRPDDAYIVASDKSKLALFPLAFDSEWSIQGQDFRVLQPGQSTETIIGSEPGAPARLAGEMTWRVRLRTGVYQTDMLGVQFANDGVKRVAVPDASRPIRENAPIR
jgi:hypothetical protein